MNITEKDIRKITIIVSVVALFVLAFLLIKPVLVPIIGGLVLAYIFFPVYQKINQYIKNKTLASSSVSILILLVLVAVVAITIPVILKQLSSLFLFYQNIDLQVILGKILPVASDNLKFQINLLLGRVIDDLLAGARESLRELALNIPSILINLFIVGFVFFFALRDSEQLKNFAKGLSPLNDAKERLVINHFKDVTDAVIYGQIIVGIIQGLLAGIGFWLIGIDGALVLTVLAVFFSIIPFVGPSFIWIPITIYLYVTGDSTTATIFLMYNLFIVSVIDNVLRSYIISRKTNLSQAIVLVGMLGGLFLFGILGLIIGPLIMAYLIALLESYKDKSLYTLFTESS